MLLALLASRVAGREMARRGKEGLPDWRVMAAGPAALAVIQIGYTVWMMSRPAVFYFGERSGG